ncbi:MAG: PEP-CTERM sorting domain-containing protein [Pseudomonadota bacterium]
MKRSLTSVLLALTFAASAHAVPVEWNLEGTTFINGNGGLSGSFVYDAETNMTSDVNITATAGSLILCTQAPPAPCAADLNAAAYPGGTFTSTLDGTVFQTGGFAGNFGLLAFGDGMFNTLSLVFETALTDVGGSVNMIGAFQWQCAQGLELCSRDVLETPFRSAFNGFGGTAGVATSTPVPAPASLLLMGLGLIALGRRRA